MKRAALSDGFKSINDVTEERRAEEALRESEEGFGHWSWGKGLCDFPLGSAWACHQPGNAGRRRASRDIAKRKSSESISLSFTLRKIFASGKPEEALRIAAQEGRYEDEGWRIRKMAHTSWPTGSSRPCETTSGAPARFAKVQATSRAPGGGKSPPGGRALQQRTTGDHFAESVGTLLHACLTVGRGLQHL